MLEPKEKMLFESSKFFASLWKLEHINALTNFTKIGKFKPIKLDKLSYRFAYKAISAQQEIYRYYEYQVWPIFSKEDETIIAICGFTPIPVKLRTSTYLEIEILEKYKNQATVMEIIAMVIAHGTEYCEIKKMYQDEVRDKLYIKAYNHFGIPKMAHPRVMQGNHAFSR